MAAPAALPVAPVPAEFDSLLQYLRRCITGRDHPFRRPEIPVYLSDVLGAYPFVGGLEPELDREPLAVIAIEGFPKASHPGMLAALDALALEYRWSTRAILLDPTAAKSLFDGHPADALRVRGRHNAANALAALALATAIGCPLAQLLHGLRDYAGEPHRVEYIATVGGIEAFDDSKGTNVGATVAALVGLGADKAPAKLVVILGGDGKGQDFSPLAAPVARHARAVALIGRDASAIADALNADAAAAAVPQQRHDSLQAAVAWCFEQARVGDAVLLSPACASLDMFRNYGHRAEVFVQAVQGVAADRGEALA